MRLSKVEYGHRLQQKLLLGFIHAITFSEPVDIIKIFMYRPEYFGKPFCDLGHAVLRGSSYWSVGERELLGAFTSNVNQSVFCSDAHGAFASAVLGHNVSHAVLTDWRTAPINSDLGSTLGFIEKLTLSPDRLGAEDVAALQAEGLTDRAIVDAIYVCVGFNIINRVADALGVQVPPPKVFVRGVKFSLIFGYRLLSGLHSGSSGSRYTHCLKVDSSQRSDDAVNDPYSSKVEQLKEAILSGAGTLDPALRKAASLAAGLPEALDSYVKKVVRHAYQVTDTDITALSQAGYSDDQIFEVTVSAALGAGLVRLELGLNALRGRRYQLSHLSSSLA